MIRPLVVSLSLLALMGCQKKDDVETPVETATPAATSAPASAPAETATGPDVTPATAPVAAAPAVLASQPGPKGTTWDLTSVSVVGEIMTVQFSVKPPPGKTIFVTGLAIDQVAVIDDATSQRYGVLKDETGRPLATPLQSSGETLRLSSASDQPVVVWLKFPALPATSTTISITIPEVGPFDGIQVAR